MMFLFSLLAATIINTATPSAAQDILNRVTDKVTEIADSLKKVYVGQIKSVGTTSVIITSSDGDQTISTNEATAFYRVRSGSQTEINFSGLKKGDDLSATGTIDPSNLEMTARQIIVKVHRYNIVGVIQTNVNNVISVKEFSGPTSQIDISDTPILKKNLGTIFSTAKLSDFKVGATVFIIAYTDPTSISLPALKAVILNL